MEDREIVALYHRREEAAVQETQIKYGIRLHAVSMNLVFDRQDAEECVNDTYLAAWNAMPPQVPNHLFAFLAKMTRHISLNRLEYRNAQKRMAHVTELSDELMECIPNPKDGMGEYEAGEVAAVISRFLYTVKPTAQALFVRRYWYGDSIAAIAQAYGLSESSVKSNLHRTRNRLKTYLQQEGICV
ncbi:MAG: RNA polymerase sigma factor [Butyricicoccus sp.]